jgi:hypothetical protein
MWQDRSLAERIVVSYVPREDLDVQFASVFEHVIKTFHFLPAREGGHP